MKDLVKYINEGFYINTGTSKDAAEEIRNAERQKLLDEWIKKFGNWDKNKFAKYFYKDDDYEYDLKEINAITGPLYRIFEKIGDKVTIYSDKGEEIRIYVKYKSPNGAILMTNALQKYNMSYEFWRFVSNEFFPFVKCMVDKKDPKHEYLTTGSFKIGEIKAEIEK